MDAHEFAWQVPKLPSPNIFFPRSRFETPMNQTHANVPSNSPRFGSGHIVSRNSNDKKEKGRNFWLEGRCNYEGMCNFAHGLEEMRDSNITTYPKTKTCRYSWKNCPYGKKCIFLHESSKQNEGNRNYLPREKSVISIEPSGGISESKRKTSLCQKWMMHNRCAKDYNCTYVHGQAEFQRATTILNSESEKAQNGPMAVVKETCNRKKVAPRVCLFKWRKTKKIVGIYADWIDEDNLMSFLASEI